MATQLQTQNPVQALQQCGDQCRQMAQQLQGLAGQITNEASRVAFQIAVNEMNHCADECQQATTALTCCQA